MAISSGHISQSQVALPRARACRSFDRSPRRQMARLLVVNLRVLLLVLGAWTAPAAAAGVRLSALARTLVVEASPRAGQVLHAGEDAITVTWSLNATAAAPGADAGYRAVKVSLCYAPASQVDRGWRKAHDDLSKDKACQLKIAQEPYAAAGGKLAYTVERDVPAASYCVRAYALDASGAQVAYGETAPSACFAVAGVTGITTPVEIAAAVLSAFSVAALAVFFVLENRKKTE
ncbi:probable high-affinity nitrate transporter-activating protein 2.2 [Oryza brachyantha]|uniref:probable high-affinity nitrate transporter-activating protein 2.2 n=1 Tax=Oryza brachyantha TaxID=4533 RepID=UPI001ADA3294|nr:probable high-affinity nitrate transporter-activating protein 2.2 [Oryza brachyantha]